MSHEGRVTTPRGTGGAARESHTRVAGACVHMRRHTVQTGLCPGQLRRLIMSADVLVRAHTAAPSVPPFPVRVLRQMTNGGLPSDQGAMPYCTFSEGKEQGNAVGQGQIEGDACFPIGEVAQQSWEIDNSNGAAQTISITFAGGEEGRYGWLPCSHPCHMGAPAAWSSRE